MDAGDDETAAGTRRCSLLSSVAVGRTNVETTGAAVEGRVSLAQIYAAAAAVCDNVDMIENDSCDDETSDEQDDDSEEDEDDE